MVRRVWGSRQRRREGSPASASPLRGRAPVASPGRPSLFFFFACWLVVGMAKATSVSYYLTVSTEKRMEDVTDAYDKSSRTKLVFSKVQGRTCSFAKRSGTTFEKSIWQARAPDDRFLNRATVLHVGGSHLHVNLTRALWGQWLPIGRSHRRQRHGWSWEWVIIIFLTLTRWCASSFSFFFPFSFSYTN
jgi:hypothetical protein